MKDKISKKIGILIKEGYKPSQATAIAHSMARRGKLPNLQQGGGLFGGLFQGLDFDQLNNIAESGIFGKDFSFEDASVLGLSGGNLGLSGAFAGSLAQDNPSIYSNYVTNAFNQQDTRQINNQILPPEQRQQLNRDIGLGERERRARQFQTGIGMNPFSGRNNQQRGRLSNRILQDREQEITTATEDYNQQSQGLQGLGSLFDIFSNLFQFQDGGEVGAQFRPDADMGFVDQIIKESKKIEKGKLRVAKILPDLGFKTVKEFQQDAGIPATGRANATTRSLAARRYYELNVVNNPLMTTSPSAPLNLPPNQRMFQSGGDVARQGYSMGSPYQNRPSITIPGGNIDMSKTPRSLYLIPDVGQPVMAHPFSGQHIFPRANSVREVPMRQYGGDAPDAVAQLERGELIALSDASIVKPKAKEMHKAMKKDKVTDILPAEMAYVFSDDPKMAVKLKDAENISLGFGAVQYKEGEDDGEQPEEILLSRFFKPGEKKLTPAEILRRVQKEFPISEETDIFAQRSSFRNKESRIPYIQALQYLTEKRKEKLGQEVVPTQFQVQSQNPFSVSYTEMLQEMQVNRLKTDPDVGYVSSPVIDKQGTTAEPQRAQLGGAIAAAIPQLFSSIFGQINAGKTKREAARLARQNEARLRQEALRQQGFLGMGTAAAFGALGAMNPEVQAPQYDPRYINAFPQRLPQSLYDTTAGRIAGANRPFIDTIFANTGDYSRAVNAVAPLQQNSVSAMADLGMQAELQNLGLRQNYLQAKDAFSQRQIAANTEAANATTGNRNAMLGQAGTLGANYFNQQGAISSGLTGSLIQNDANAFNARTAARMQGQQALGQGLGAISGALTSPGFQNLFSGGGQQAGQQLGTLGGQLGNISTGGGAWGVGAGVYSQPSYFQGGYHNQYLAPQIPPLFPWLQGF